MAMAPAPRMGRGGGERSEPGVRVPRRHCALHGWELLPAMPRPSHNEAPLPDRERGGEPGALWAHEPG